MDKDKIEMKALMESAAVAEYLTQLAKGFKSGNIIVEKDGESLSLTPCGTAEVEVEARVKKDKARFSLEVTWRMGQAEDSAAGFSISAGPAASGEKPAAKVEDKKPEEKKIDSKQPEVKMPEEKKAAQPEAKPVAAPAAPAAKPVVVEAAKSKA